MAASARRRLAHYRAEQLEVDTPEACALLVKLAETRCTPAPRTVRPRGRRRMAEGRAARGSRPPFATISMAGFGAPGEWRSRFLETTAAACLPILSPLSEKRVCGLLFSVSAGLLSRREEGRQPPAAALHDRVCRRRQAPSAGRRASMAGCAGQPAGRRHGRLRSRGR